MRKFILLHIAILFCTCIIAQGIKFENLSWNQLLDKAKKEKKIIFVDAYATWCGPCKYMAKNVFTTDKVGSFFNSKFINAKIDMEAGEGISLAQKFNVTAYPTYLFVNGEGKLLHVFIGSMEADAFVAAAADALNPDKQIYTLKDKYKSGTITSSQLSYLLTKASEMEDKDAIDIARNYFKQQTNLYTKENIELMINLVRISGSPEYEYYKFLQTNEDKAGAIVGKRELGDFLDAIAGKAALKLIDEKTALPETITQLEKIIAKYRPENASKIALGYGIYLASETKDWNSYEKFALKYLDKFSAEFNEQAYNEFAWNFYLNISDKSSLKKALGWALESVKIASLYYNNDTVAHLYYKLGDKKNAKLYAEKSIKLGRDAGDDVSETEKLLSLL